MMDSRGAGHEGWRSAIGTGEMCPEREKRRCQ